MMAISSKLTHEQRHDILLETGAGSCKVCNKTYAEILFEDSYADITLGGHYVREDEAPCFHDGIKILEALDGR